MSSGTLGAAMEAAMLGVRSLALSFAFFNHDISSDKVENACQISTNILHKLWHKDAWKSTGSPLFNINIPLVLNPHPPIYITTMGQSHIGSLYVKESRSYKQSYLSVAVDDAQVQNAGSGDHEMDGKDGDAFRFSVAGTRSETDAVLGTDAWAIRKKAVSITPLRPALDSLVEAEKSPFWQQLEFQTI
ncbi:hypothetical protein LPJ78_002732 [Coemansia sp. RSA 989]|nr:hypothetical protein LPJ68_002061 [Coemansia sp. RSA 1086]KAJ1750749.1 hypothetical protein LPJ79_002654 [Coemansia sp. RSA 1821]KAJ1865395.1 hypothetical protein LPJ78_002732 [Coemansia sp. RSA 989]KAJ1872713.1 hypothetical protein LPJ55_002871 [Coemansia sp. RSA 990]KAJ2647586.1 hypothetical protein IWW40_004570 [Coemansia sp. RSA 1250]KAJ2669511.1 hypothetical protein IWW42_004554 [Coemansia sp. RSA 1085]